MWRSKEWLLIRDREQSRSRTLAPKKRIVYPQNKKQNKKKRKYRIKRDLSREEIGLTFDMLDLNK